LNNNNLQPADKPEIPISDDPWKEFRKGYPLTLLEAVLWLTALTGMQQGLKWLVDNQHLSLPQSMSGIALHATVYVIGTVVLLLYWKLIRKSKLRTLGLSVGPIGAELKFLAVMVVAAIVIYAFAGLAFWTALHFFADDATTAFKQHLRNSVFPDDSALHAVAVIVMYPIMEEIWFRGLLYTPMRDQMGRIPAIIVLSLLFAFAHGNTYPVNQFIGGLIFVWAYEKRRTLLTPILLHMAGNGVLFLFGWALGNWPAFDKFFR
jgi:uncharacterized protein